MFFQFGFYSSLLLIFFVHMTVYAFLLIRKYSQQQHPASGWLSLFLLLAALYISPWMLGFAGWYDTQPYNRFLLYTPLQHLFAIGPVVYFYVQSLLNPGFRFRKKNLLHFVPAVLYLVYAAWMAVYDILGGRPARVPCGWAGPGFRYLVPGYRICFHDLLLRPFHPVLCFLP